MEGSREGRVGRTRLFTAAVDAPASKDREDSTQQSRKESAHLQLHEEHRRRLDNERRGDGTPVEGDGNDESEDASNVGGTGSESQSIIQSETKLMEFRTPDGERFASLGVDESIFSIFLDLVARGRHGQVKDLEGTGGWSARGLNGAPSSGDGTTQLAAGEDLKTPGITVSDVDLSDEATKEDLQQLWRAGRLLSQDRDAAEILRGKPSFSDLLMSYTKRTKENHWEEIPKARLVQTLRRYNPQVVDLCQYAPEKSVEETILSLKGLLEWFRKDFPYYYGACLSCESRNSTFMGYVHPSQEELDYKAGRTELYWCPACGQVSRFARFTAVSKVLETRRGRCGEYSVLMLHLLEALGYSCRWVVDWEDHVWLEASIGGRWVHIDPCEAAVDEPLLYESWGKQQTYILAFSPQEVVDVTSTYTSDFEAAKSRRDVGEDTIRSLISSATKELQDG
ncbi:unnamed protein product [Discosporangium mesarthrocarpum]